MRGGYPIHVYFIRTIVRKAQRVLWRCGTVGSKFSLNCGHWHKSEVAARKCEPRMIEEYKAARWSVK